jgi:ABC-type dipeptide/oligopeptide/nickel transport system ATPase component
MSLLSISLTVRYAGKPEVLRNACLSIEPGETVGLAGQSGSGKSTMALAILGLMNRRTASVSGEVLFNGRDLLKASEKQLRAVRGKEIALVLQSALSSLNPSMTVGGHLWEAWRAHSSEGREVWRQRVFQLLEDVSLPANEDFLGRRPRELSVGIAQRVLIAMSVLHRPSLLIADEPTSALDVITQSETLKLFQGMNVRFGMAILFISHDLLAVASLCRRVAILHRGTIVETGQTANVFANPIHPYTAKLIQSLPGLPQAAATDDLLRLAAATLTEDVPIGDAISRETR